MNKEQREKRNFYTRSGMLVTGLSCAPDSPDYWFVPSEQSSLCYGIHIFDTEKEGLEAGLKSLREQQEQIRLQIISTLMKLDTLGK